jgi:hypothetical protein
MPESSPEEWAFRFAPINIRSEGDLDSFAAHRELAEDVLKDYLKEAFHEGWLPPSVVLAQFASVPSAASVIDLRLPAFIRKRVRRIESVIRAFSFTTHHSLRKQWSFYNKANSELHCPASTLLIFTVDQKPPLDHPFPGVNVIWVSFAATAIPACPRLSLIKGLYPKSIPNDETLAMVETGQIISDDSNEAGFSWRPNTLREYPVWNSYPRVGMEKEFVGALGEFAKSLLSKEYLESVAPCVAQGPLVLALTKKMFFHRMEQNQFVDNSGLTSIFEPGTTLGFGELEDCFRVAHRLSTVFTSLHTVAQHVSRMELERGLRKGARNAFGMITHSLGNAIEMMDRTPNAVRRVLFLERYTLAAAGSLHQPQSLNDESMRRPWERAGCKTDDGAVESIGQSLGAAIFTKDGRSFTIEDQCMTGKVPDARFVALLIELARNLQKHAGPAGGSIKLLMSNDKRWVSLQVASSCTFEYPRNLPTYFEQWKAGFDSERGQDYLWLLIRSLATPRTSVSYRFGLLPPGGESNQRPHTIIEDIPIFYSITPDATTQLQAVQEQGDTTVRFSFVHDLRNLKGITTA